MSKQYEDTFIGNVAKIVSTPAFIASAPAVVATGAVYGSQIAAGASAAAAGAKSAVSNTINKAQNAINKVSAAGTAVSAVKKVTSSNPTLPLAPQTISASGITGGQNTPLYKPGQSTSDYSGQTPLMENPTYAIPTNPQATSMLPVLSVNPTETPYSGTNRTSTTTRRTSTKKKASSSRKKKTSKRAVKAKSHAKKYSKSSKKIHYTKTGQPYIIVAGGKARFIKKTSAHNRKKRKGGYY